MRKLSARARWAVPAGVVAITGVVIAAAAVASAAAAPSLPSRSASQLLAEVAQGTARPFGPLTATVQETSDFGLPALPAIARQPGTTSPLTNGAQSVSIWYRDAQHLRVAEPVQAGETDLRLDGRTLWVWNSRTQTATRYALPAHITGLPAQAGNGLGLGAPGASKGAPSQPVPDTPQQAAAQILKAVGPTTVVSVQRNVYVAGRAAYQLSLVPRSSKSLVGSVLIAVDASRHIPLRVEVYPRGSSALAYSVGFTALTFGTPAASNFTFTPPPGATVKKVTVPGNVQSLLRQDGLGASPLTALGAMASPADASPADASPAVSVGGSAPLSSTSGMVLGPAPSKKALAEMKARLLKSLPKNMPKAERAKIIRQIERQMSALPKGRTASGWSGYAPASISPGDNGGGFFSASDSQAGAPRVLGTGWLSVVATPPNPQVASTVRQLLSGKSAATPQASAATFSSTATAYSSTLTASPDGGLSPAVLRALLQAATPVHGSWGSGRLLRTRLLTVLVTSKGQILAGAVTPGVLYADVAADAG